MASEGDPRVLFVMNLVLSAVFSLMLVTALDLAGIATYTTTRVVVTALFLMVITWFVVLR